MSSDEGDASNNDIASDSSNPRKLGYGSVHYWNDRYANWAQKPYDWIFQWKHVKHVLDPFVQKSDRILLPGCGNAPFSLCMYDDGYEHQIGIDNSTAAIKAMRNQNKTARPNMSFVLMDACDTWYKDKHFDCIIDKSLIDTTVCMTNGRKITKRFVAEMHRVLKSGGYYVTMSLHTWAQTKDFFMQRAAGVQFAGAAVTMKNPDFHAGDEDDDQADEVDEAESYFTLMVCKKMPASATQSDLDRESAVLHSMIEQYDEEEDMKRCEEFSKAKNTKIRVERIQYCLKAIGEQKRLGNMNEKDASFYKDYLLTRLETEEAQEEEVELVTGVLIGIIAKAFPSVVRPPWASQHEPK